VRAAAIVPNRELIEQQHARAIPGQPVCRSAAHHPCADDQDIGCAITHRVPSFIFGGDASPAMPQLALGQP
jgi:hypothetical protein